MILHPSKVKSSQVSLSVSVNVLYLPESSLKFRSLGGNLKKSSPIRPGPSILTSKEHSSDEGFSEEGSTIVGEGVRMIVEKIMSVTQIFIVGSQVYRGV